MTQSKPSGAVAGPQMVPALSPRKTRVFRVLLLMIPLLFFIFLELLLRLFGYGSDIPLFKTLEANPRYNAINPALGQRYFPATGVSPMVAFTDHFLKEKPSGALRIFVLGGSTTAGYPYLYNGSFPSILKAFLNAYYPERYIEIVNLAMPAVSSYTVRDIALELGDYQPDLLLIYAGHNEFYGGLGLGSTESLGRQRWFINLYLKLRDYKTFQLLGNLMAALQHSVGDPGPAGEDGATLMERMAGERHIPYHSDLFFQAADNFAGNIDDILQYASARDIPVMIGTLVSNIRDQAPFVDVFADPAGEVRWREAYREAQAAFERGDYPAARSGVQRCIALDSLPASQYFLQGRIHEAQGDSAGAYGAFYRAKEFDGLRFRASELLNRRIGQFADKPGVAVVPVKEAFEAASPARLPGASLLLEHLHPNLAGYTLMARAYGEVILQSGLAGPPPAAPLPDSLWMARRGVTAIDRIVADMRIRFLMMGWPFQPGSPPGKASLPYDRNNPLDVLAYRFWMNELTWEEMHVEAAAYYRRSGEWELAAAEYRALIHAIPANPSPYLILADMLIQKARPGEARVLLEELLQTQPAPQAYRLIGQAYQAEGGYRAALPYFEQAAALGAADPDVHLQLARAYAESGDFNRAYAYVKRVLAMRPGNEAAQQLNEMIIKHFQQDGTNGKEIIQ
ncbi:MAG: tetratricopeptide repeat protein [Calditrichae bacterium]|nr:tetratricopeptide repeat protein [Calditrichia bacterium]